ncbi:MAG: hypothetical protein WCH75_04145 [Candidatus Binatia bacterium]
MRSIVIHWLFSFSKIQGTQNFDTTYSNSQGIEANARRCSGTLPLPRGCTQWVCHESGPYGEARYDQLCPAQGA